MSSFVSSKASLTEKCRNGMTYLYTQLECELSKEQMVLNNIVGNSLVLIGAIICLTYLKYMVTERHLTELQYRAWAIDETSV